MNTEIKHLGNIFKQEGTSRYERYLPALDPKTILLDDRKLQDFIAYAQRYSKNLLFIDPERSDVDLKDSWEYFFKSDIILLIANIATKKAAYFKTTYDQLSLQFKEARTIENFHELARYTFARYKKINSWYYASTKDSSLYADLKLYIGSYLQRELDNLKEILFYVHNIESNNYKFENFKRELFNTADKHELDELIGKENIWAIKVTENIKLREHIFAGNTDEEKLSSALLVLNNVFDAVFHVTETIINNCNNYFQETIHQKQDHPPHIALFITFLKLFGYVQDELNKIPQKHLDFYYKDVLRIKRKEAIPDQAFIVFELAKGFDAYEIKKGTTLSAGKDRQNQELIYETDEDYIINKAQIASLHTIFIEQDTASQTLNYYTESVGNKAANSPSTYTNASASSWKMFGKPNPEAITEIGFAIASTQLNLAKGKRNIIITFIFLDPIAIEQFDTSILKLLVTGEKGWLSSEDAENGITINAVEKLNTYSLQLNFCISIKQESAIIAYNKNLHAGSFETNLPILQCILKYPPLPVHADDNQLNEYESKISQLNIIQKLRVSETSIRVEVGTIDDQVRFDGIRDLQLQNHESELDNKKPFYPFTAIPKVGSSFYIGCKDLFYKNIEKLSLNIAWMLPDNFNSHYSKYLPPYDTNNFTASLSILKDKEWIKLKDVSIIDKDASEPKFKSIKIEFEKLDLLALADDTNESMTYFDSDRKNGTLKLKLNYPDFGHTIYPQLITSAVMEKAASQNATVNYHKIIKQELHDSVISIKMPADIENRTGSLKVVYDIIERIQDEERAKFMLLKSLSEVIRKQNGTNIIVRGETPMRPDEESPGESFGHEIVNDDNFIENILGFLKKVKLIDNNIHYDLDKENANTVINNIKDKVNSKADFMLPSDKKLIQIILNEITGTISRIAINVVEGVVSLRVNGTPETGMIADLIKKEVNEANEVINDIIAHKISVLLSANEIPAAPYSPLISNISISYTSVKPSYVGNDQFFHITPFGNLPITLLSYDSLHANANANETFLKTKSILPKSIIVDQEVPGDMQGMLLIGIKDLVPNQSVSLLIQVAEGTKLNDKKPPSVIWWYLRHYEWIQLSTDAIVSNSTYDLQTTGIIELAIPSDATNQVSLFGQEPIYWLCASVVREMNAFPQLIDIKAQATWVTFKNQNNDPSHLALPLEAHKINSLVHKLPQVKQVMQPVSSFKGQVKEQNQEYYIRVSERLRHKARAITNWDYERLVLAHFPAIYKVKCINNYYDGHFAIGHVTIVPVADLRNKEYKGSDVLIPKISYIELRQIEEILYAKASPFVKIHAINPQLDKILIRCKVKFHSGIDKGYYLRKLNEDLIHYLTPWIDGKEALLFSAKLYASAIINFIDQRAYVDYVADLEMKQYLETEDGDKIFCINKEQTTSLVETNFTTAHAILVSAPKHEIELAE